MHKVFLGIGGNIGDKQKNFESVYSIIENVLGKIVNASSVYETPPWGFQSDDPFWNSVIEIESTYTPEQLLEEIHKIENLFDRKRESESYSSRQIDIDILYFDDLYMETETLIIPHRYIPHRKFVLVPLNQIVPNFKHPLLRLTSSEMLESCKDQSIIKRVQD